MEFEIQQNDLSWHGKIGDKPICEFEYFKDDRGRIWINKIATYGNYLQKGYGTKMIIEAWKIYNEIYVSAAKKMEILRIGLENDSRYTNDEHLADNSPLMLFVQKLIDKGILKSEWKKHPFNDV